jgi:hypothetical protein
MRKIAGLSLFSFILLLSFTSCQKETVEQVKKERVGSVFSSAENKSGLPESLRVFLEEKSIGSSSANGNGKGSEFIAPFSDGAGYGFGSFDFATGDYKGVYFQASLDDKDFYRENPDGTITVHVNSTDAYAEYFDGNWFTGETRMYLYGESAHFNVNYTGRIYEFSFVDQNGETIVIKFFSSDDSKAVVYQGNGKVGVDGKAPWQMLTMKVLTPASGSAVFQYKVGDIFFRAKF